MDVVLVSVDPDLDEMRGLVDAAGHRVVREVVQRRGYPDARTYVGKGKLEELREIVVETGAQAVIVAGVVHPKQHHNLEKALKVPCHDRLRVILDIFTQRANGPEAKLQVEYAMLQYEVPLLKEWIHAGSAGDRPGFLSGGEYRVDSYYETVKRRMVKIRKSLETVRSERSLRRDRRKSRGFHHVSIAGYTNAGKSSLFNLLSGERIPVEDRLFTTLSTTTRVLGPKSPARRILLTDTVGLVSDIPLWMIEAFRSTFEETLDSDLVLLLLDVTDDDEEIFEKLELARDVLSGDGSTPPIQVVLTKIDLADKDRVVRLAGALDERAVSGLPVLAVSTVTREGVEVLGHRIHAFFEPPVEISISIAPSPQAESFLHWLHERAQVMSVDRTAGSIDIRLRCYERDVRRIDERSRLLRGTT